MLWNSKEMSEKCDASKIKVLRHHLLLTTNHEADKVAGASVCIQEVHIMNRACWLVATLTERKIKKQTFYFSLALVVKITCTSTSLVNCEAFSPFCTDSVLESLIDECSHCKLLSKSTIWTSIQLGASRKGKRHLDWMSFEKAHNS